MSAQSNIQPDLAHDLISPGATHASEDQGAPCTYLVDYTYPQSPICYPPGINQHCPDYQLDNRGWGCTSDTDSMVSAVPPPTKAEYAGQFPLSAALLKAWYLCLIPPVLVVLTFPLELGVAALRAMARVWVSAEKADEVCMNLQEKTVTPLPELPGLPMSPEEMTACSIRLAKQHSV